MVGAALAALSAWSAPLAAQRGAQAVEAQIRQLQADAARAAHERDSLQAVLRRLESSFRDMTAEAKNLEQQTDATARAVNAFDRQLRTLNEEVDSASGSLVRAQDELLVKQATLHHRLVDIYKRGPLYSFEALLSAESFGQLVTRYKYLRVVALRDRALVQRTEQLRNAVSGKRDEIVDLQYKIGLSRAQRAEEEQRLRGLERQWQLRLAATQRNTEAAQRSLARSEAAKKRVDDAVTARIAELRRGETRSPSAAPVAGSFLPSDLQHPQLAGGRRHHLLVWAPEESRQHDHPLGWCGNRGPVGTPVRAVAAGVVQIAEPMSTYGNCVMILHGENWSSYCGLQRITVGKGQAVEKGDQVGTVGVIDPDVAPHLHFQIRDAEGHAMDPLEWLRRKQ